MLRKLTVSLLMLALVLVGCEKNNDSSTDTSKASGSKEKSEHYILGYVDDNDNFQDITDEQFKTHVRGQLGLTPSDISSWSPKSFHADTAGNQEFVRIRLELTDGSSLSFSQSLKDPGDFEDPDYRAAGNESCTCKSTGCSAFGCEVVSMCSCSDCGNNSGGECTKTHKVTAGLTFSAHL
ncbi:MAG: hypothetical protein RI565_05595 [Schleiferiaceae bacterium]|nr:hypothetical protein [Schleiferiaceae bacterium]